MMNWKTFILSLIAFISFTVHSQDEISKTVRYYSNEINVGYDAYNQDGDLVYSEFKDEDEGKLIIVGLTVKRYDDKRRLVARYQASKYGPEIEVEVHEYSEKNNNHKVFSYSVVDVYGLNEGGIPALKRVYKSKSFEKLKVSPDGKRQLETEEKYDSKGRVISKSNYMEGEVLSKSSKVYDEEQKILTETFSIYEDLINTSITQFNEDGKIDNIVSVDKLDTVGVYTCVYDENGNQIEDRSMDQWSDRVNLDTYKWDETSGKHLLMKKVITNYGEKEREFNYTYDERGNMTSLIEQSEGNEDDDNFRWEYTYFD